MLENNIFINYNLLWISTSTTELVLGTISSLISVLILSSIVSFSIRMKQKSMSIECTY